YKYLWEEHGSRISANSDGLRSAKFRWPLTTRDETESRPPADKGGKRRGRVSSCAPLSFDDLLSTNYMEEWAREDEVYGCTVLWPRETITVINYYLQQYRLHRGKEHPNLMLEQWRRVAEEIGGFIISDPYYNQASDIDVEDYCQIINQHFLTKYQAGCDYNILHFVSSEAIRYHRFCELNM
ncbi:MAG: hypothetical protein ACQES8_03335, partial [Thermodesulfobacteriota bacterium]